MKEHNSMDAWVEVKAVVSFEIDHADPSVGIFNTETSVAAVELGGIDITKFVSEAAQEQLCLDYVEKLSSEYEAKGDYLHDCWKDDKLDEEMGL